MFLISVNLFTAILFVNILNAQVAGSLDLSFDPQDNYILSDVNESVQLPDGKIMVVGEFSNVGGNTNMNKIAKLNSNGTPATDFISSVSAPSLNSASFKLYCLALQSDGKVLIGGNFTNYSGFVRNKIVRIYQDGTIDSSFDPGSGFTGILSRVKDIKIQQDGKILVAGDFTSFNGNNLSGIIRLNQDGSLDSSFTPQTGIYQFQINSIDIQSDGKIIAGGPFAYIGSVNVRIVRFNNDGTIDSTFNPNANGSATNINRVLVQTDGKVLIAGQFSSLNGNQNIKNIARVDSNGIIDPDFIVGSNPGGMIHDIHLDANGKIVVVGTFATWNNSPSNRIVRLNSNGTFDSEFNSGNGTNNGIYCVTNQADGKYLIGGGFTQYNNIYRYSFARLNGDGTNDILDNYYNEYNSYPNPFNESLTIESGNIIQNISISDISGKIIFNKSNNLPIIKINTTDWKTGVYFIKVNNQTNKIIK